MQYKSSNILEGKVSLNLFIIPISSLHKYVVCFFHDSLLSIKRQRNGVDSTKSIDVFMRERFPGKVEI